MGNKTTALDRRSFLKFAGIAAAGAAASGAVTATGCASGGDVTYAETIEWSHAYDVVIIGFGGAGAAAALTAAEAGAKVLLLEKAPLGHAGGNSRYCGQNFGYCPPEDKEKFKQYYKNLRGAFSTPADEVIDEWVEEFSLNQEWLTKLGATQYKQSEKTEEPTLAPDGMKAMRARVEAFEIDGKAYDTPSGTGYWNMLYANVMKHTDMIDIWYNAQGAHLFQDPVSKAVVGVEVKKGGKKYQVQARNGVVLACGGYEGDKRMLEDFTCLTNVYPMGNVYNTGDGIIMATEVGARLWHLNNVLCPYISILPPSQNVRAVFPQVGSPIGGGSHILVGPEGKRFRDEYVSDHHSRIEDQGVTVVAKTFDNMWFVMDEAARQYGIDTKVGGGHFAAGYQDALDAGIMKSAATIEELAEVINVDPAGLKATVERWNGFVEAGVDEDFGRDFKMEKISEQGPYYAYPAVRAILNSQGGAERNGACEVLDASGKPIPHLYSAGEFGFIASLLYNGGGNLGDTAASGRIAGRNAAAQKDPLPPYPGGKRAKKTDAGTEVFPEDEWKSFESSGNEYYGVGCGSTNIVCKVVMGDGGKIESVEVVQNGETEGVGDPAIEQIPAKIVETQSLSVDVVSGATLTSSGIVYACKQALANDYPEIAEAAEATFTPEYRARKDTDNAKKKASFKAQS